MSVDSNAKPPQPADSDRPAPQKREALTGGEWWWDIFEIAVQALAIALVVRTLFFQPFNIPSGSMKETLLVGDYLFVSKLSYGYSKYSFFGLPLFNGRILSREPKRGDVVVFKLPRDNSTDYIKRVIGLPGDEIQVQQGVLYINGKALPRKRDGDFTTIEDGVRRTIPVFDETLPEGKVIKILKSDPSGQGSWWDNTAVYKVPPGYFFMMGDNRDNSQDSRFLQVGYVPFENLIGRAEIIWFSARVDDPAAFRLTAPWTWPFDIRWSRFFKFVN